MTVWRKAAGFVVVNDHPPQTAPAEPLSAVPHNQPMPELPAYSGDTALCEKCGWVGASTEYQPAGMLCRDHPSTGVRWVERQHRACNRCGYGWDEAVVEPGWWA